MKLRLPILFSLLTALVLSTGPVHAQQKIAYVDMKRLLEQAPQVIGGRERLDLEFRPRNEALDEEKARLESLEDRLQRDAALMTAAQAAELEREVRELRRYVRRAQEDLRDEFAFRLNQELEHVNEVVNEAVRSLARRRGFDLVLSSPVMYASENVDITDDALSELTSDFETAQNDGG
ncbi:MAG: hypothetical protein DHS20C11_08710 [Lysobacteraceae bacterium]|nr:MAG: hypothetical protein DHS20C11_08710 [Xanthomonadaceae bacterium]